MMQFLQSLQSTPYAAWVREQWGWAFALTIHAFGNATVVGLIFIIGLRLFGFFKSVPLPTLKSFFPFIWVGVVFQVLSGVTMWMTKPAKYVQDPVFIVKFSLVVIGVIVTIPYQKYLIKHLQEWQAEGNKVSSRGVAFAALTCFVWAGVLVMGRLTAYLGQLYQ